MTFVLNQALEKDTFLVTRSGALQIRLVNDARYFWVMIVPETDATELHELDDRIAESLWLMARHLGWALKTHCKAVKINTAAIGNLIPQLHCHIVARHINDEAWPHPVWGRGASHPLTNVTKAARLLIIQSWLGKM